jgi:hypothetical protein
MIINLSPLLNSFTLRPRSPSPFIFLEPNEAMGLLRSRSTPFKERFT